MLLPDCLLRNRIKEVRLAHLEDDRNPLIYAHRIRPLNTGDKRMAATGQLKMRTGPHQFDGFDGRLHGLPRQPAARGEAPADMFRANA